MADRLIAGRAVVEGEATGEALVTSEALSFWGGYDFRTGEIIDKHHPLTGVRAGTIDEPGTINYLVDQRLRRMADILRDRHVDETRVIRETEAIAPPPPPKPPGPPEPPR